MRREMLVRLEEGDEDDNNVYVSIAPYNVSDAGIDIQSADITSLMNLQPNPDGWEQIQKLLEELEKLGITLENPELMLCG